MTVTLCRTLLIVAAFTISVFSFSASAATDIDSLASAIASSSPDVRLSRLAGESEARSLRAENRLADPSVDFEHLWGSQPIGNKYTLGVSQEFQLPMAYSGRSRLASAVEQRALAQESVYESSVRLQAKILLLTIAFDRRILALHDSISALASARAAMADTMLQRGALTRLDCHKAAVSAVSARGDLESARRDLAQAEQALAVLAGSPSVGVGHISTPLLAEAPLPWQAYLDAYNLHNPYPALLSATEAVASRRLDAIKSERWPSFSLGYVFNNEMGDKFHGLSVGITLPVYSRSNQVKAADLTARQLLLSDEVTSNAVLSEMRRAHADALSLWSEITLLRNLLDHDADLSLIDRMRQVQRINSVDAMAETIEMLRTRISLLQSERAYAIALATLTR